MTYGTMWQRRGKEEHREREREREAVREEAR
jgi:hypothetical protein